MNTQTIYSWGNWPRIEQTEGFCEWPDELRKVEGERLYVGLRRSYGDVCLAPSSSTAVNCTPMALLQNLNQTLELEGGVSLNDLIQITIGKKLFPKVVPGTKYITIGGAIANDIHGKNHSKVGTFGNNVEEITLYRTDSGVITTKPGDPLFHATLGGIGLTGCIIKAKIKMTPIPSSWLTFQNTGFQTLEEFHKLSEQSQDWEHTVAWLDCTNPKGKGIFMRGNWTEGNITPHKNPKISIPIFFPNHTLNNLSVCLFNSFYWIINKNKTGTQHYNPFFFPLDFIGQWNRIYGRRGFTQFQCAIPKNNRNAIEDLLKEISKSKLASFLAVLKTFGNIKPQGWLSFSIPEGTTLALDFPMENKTLEVIKRLEEITLKAKGKIYLAKDATMSPKTFQTMYPNWEDLEKIKDPLITSALWNRLTKPK